MGASAFTLVASVARVECQTTAPDEEPLGYVAGPASAPDNRDSHPPPRRHGQSRVLAVLPGRVGRLVTRAKRDVRASWLEPSCSPQAGACPGRPWELARRRASRLSVLAFAQVRAHESRSAVRPLRTTRECADRARADDRDRRRKRALTGGHGRTSLDRPERGRATPPPGRPSGHARALRGRRATDARRHAIRPARYRRPAGGANGRPQLAAGAPSSPARRPDRLAH
jgi:hypothetical protein